MSKSTHKRLMIQSNLYRSGWNEAIERAAEVHKKGHHLDCKCKRCREVLAILKLKEEAW